MIWSIDYIGVLQQLCAFEKFNSYACIDVSVYNDTANL